MFGTIRSEFRPLFLLLIQRKLQQALLTGCIPRSHFESLSSTDRSAEESIRGRYFSLSILLQEHGIPHNNTRPFLENNQFVLNLNLVQVATCLEFLSSLELSQKSYLFVLSAYPRLLEIEHIKKFKVLFSKLSCKNAQQRIFQSIFERISKYSDPDKVLTNLTILQGFGCSDETLTKVVENFPEIFTLSHSFLNDCISNFKKMKLDERFDQILKQFPGVLSVGIQCKLAPLFDEFQELGFDLNKVRKMVISNPFILNAELGEFSQYVELLRSLKCRIPIQQRILRNGFLEAAVHVKNRVDCLCKNGLSCRDSLKVVEREPRVIIYARGDIQKKVDYLLQKFRLPIECLTEVPQYLGMHLEKVIIPRYEVLEHLNSAGALGRDLELKGVVKLTRQKFYNQFVKPYPECCEIFDKTSGKLQDKINQHPAGLWKLFKPKSHPLLKEDQTNIRLFVESLH